MANRALNQLTITSLRSLVRRATENGISIAKADGGGLTFTVSKTGYAAWILRYRHDSKAREYTIDTVDASAKDFGLVEARAERDKLRSRIKAGEDIAATKQIPSPEEHKTFKNLADAWYERAIKPVYDHPERVQSVLDRYILPTLGALAPETITPGHIDHVLRSIVEQGARTVANDSLRHIRNIFKYGRKRGVVSHNVAADFDLSDAGGKESTRKRSLDRQELKVLFTAMKNTPNLGRPNELTFKLLLALCVRKMELVGAAWSDFDLERGVWMLTKERTKTKVPIEIPLAPVVVEWLRELKVFAAGSIYVLPARRITKQQRFGHISPDTLNLALKRVNHGLEHFTVHDARRTARTLLASLGVSDAVAERALNHKLTGVPGIYNVFDYYEERREALRKLADLIVTLDGGNVVPLKKRRADGGSGQAC